MPQLCQRQQFQHSTQVHLGPQCQQFIFACLCWVSGSVWLISTALVVHHVSQISRVLAFVLHIVNTSIKTSASMKSIFLLLQVSQADGCSCLGLHDHCWELSGAYAHYMQQCMSIIFSIPTHSHGRMNMYMITCAVLQSCVPDKFRRDRSRSTKSVLVPSGRSAS